MTELERLYKKVERQEQQITELLVALETAQAALRRVQSAKIDPQEKEQILNSGALWVLNMRM